ncbi:hypothetical protein K7W03_27440, partial [Sphingobium sp. PNB]|uniref:hypothetical protein n=1 Tax=Sphingobium sp. PNB TaxID=863934 RepID=UPI001CA3C0B5
MASMTPDIIAALQYARNLIGPDEIIDAALSTSPAGQEVREIAERAIELLIEHAEGLGEIDELERRLDAAAHSSVEPAGNVGLDLSAIGSGHCYCWCHPNAGAIGCSPCCDAEDNYLPPSKRDPALSSVEPAGNGREAVENAFIAGWEAQKA